MSRDDFIDIQLANKQRCARCFKWSHAAARSDDGLCQVCAARLKRVAGK